MVPITPSTHNGPSLALYTDPLSPRSFSIRCLLGIARLWFITHNGNEDMSPDGQLPFAHVLDSNSVLAKSIVTTSKGSCEVKEKKKDKNNTKKSSVLSYRILSERVVKQMDLHVDLSEVQCSEIRAYSALLQQLEDAIMYMYWCDDANYNTVTRYVAGARLPWPLSRIIPAIQRHSVTVKLSIRHPGRVNQEYFSALSRGVLETLAERLGDDCQASPAFFPGCLTELDALVMGQLYLAQRSYLQLPNNFISKHLNLHGNLLLFMHAMNVHLLYQHENSQPIRGDK